MVWKISSKFLLWGMQEQNKASDLADQQQFFTGREWCQTRNPDLFFFICHKIYRKIPKPEKKWEDNSKPLPFPNLRFKNKQGTNSNAQTTLSSYSRSKPEFIPPPQDFSQKEQLRYPGVWLKLDTPDEIRLLLPRLCYGSLRKTSQNCIWIIGVKITEILYHSYTLTGTK